MSLSLLGLGACVVATLWVVIRGLLHERYLRAEREASCREVDAIHAEIAHVVRVDGIKSAVKVVDLAYAQQLTQLDEDQRRQAQMLKGDPVAMAKYIQAVIDQGKGQA